MTEILQGSDLAMAMLDWEKKRRELDALEDQIKTSVLAMDEPKTQTVGNVRATYSKPRVYLDYQAAADGHMMVTAATIKLFSKVIPEEVRIDWKSICEHAGIDDIPVKETTEPAVTIKLL